MLPHVRPSALQIIILPLSCLYLIRLGPWHAILEQRQRHHVMMDKLTSCMGRTFLLHAALNLSPMSYLTRLSYFVAELYQ
jgi:hypothetical protein